MRGISIALLLMMSFRFALGDTIAYASEKSYSIMSNTAIVGQEYVLILIIGEHSELKLADGDDSILYIEQKTATEASISFANITADFEKATAFIVSEEGVLVKCQIFDDVAVDVLTLPSSIKEIEEEAFEGVSANIIICPNGLISIRSRAFANCPNLSEIHIPISVIEMEEDIFLNSPNVVIHGSPNSAAKKYADLHGLPFSEAN